MPSANNSDARVIIEKNSVELLELFDKVSTEAKKEKKAVPPINKMIYYWTRKPLVVGRAIVLASTLKNVKDVEDLLCIGDDHRAYTKTPDRAKYKRRLGQDPSTISILDSFAGAGNLAFPALELGLNVSISDYNPLSYLICKGTLEYTVYANENLPNNFKKAAAQVIKETELKVGHFYSPKHLAYLWLWCITCPYCSQRTPLTNQMYIANTKNLKLGMRFTPTRNKGFTVKLVCGMSAEEGKKFTHKGKTAQCISCKNTIDYKSMTGDIAKNKDRELVAIQVQGQKSRKFVLPTDNDKRIYKSAMDFFKDNADDLEEFIPTEEIKPSHSSVPNTYHYGVYNWRDLHSSRQLLVLAVLVSQIREFTKSNMHRPELTLYLCFLLAKLIDSYSYGTTWNPAGIKPEPTLALRRPSIVFNIAEINPFESVRGSLKNITKNISNGISFASRLGIKTRYKLESVTSRTNSKYDLIITDPPYGDDVQYGELSEFFYIWMYQILKDLYPELPPRPKLEEDFCEAWGRFGNKKLASEFFGEGLKTSFKSMNRKLKDTGLLVVIFAHSSPKVWNQLLAAIREGKFRIVASYALHTESKDNPLARNKTSFMSSIVVVCRKSIEESEVFFEDIVPEMEDGIKDMINAIPDEKLLQLPITDLLVMVYGKILESCTKHTVLKSKRSDFVPDFETLISDSHSFLLRLLVSRLTHKSINIIGPRMAFYLFVKVFHKGTITSDEILKMSKANDIDLNTLQADNVLKKVKGRYELLYLTDTVMDYPADRVDPKNLHQQLCYLAYMVHINSSDKILSLLSQNNFVPGTLKQAVALLLKSYGTRKNRGEYFEDAEMREIEILQTLSTIMGIRPSGGGLDVFMEAGID